MYRLHSNANTLNVLTKSIFSILGSCMVYRGQHVWQLMFQVYSHCKHVVASWPVTSL